MFDRIESLLNAHKNVGSAIAHDLRRPLAGAVRRLEAARGGEMTPGNAQKAIEAAIADIHGVLETFNAILRIGQIEAGARRAGFKRVDLAEVAREVVEAFQPAAEEEGKILAADLSVVLPLSGDRELLTQMVANLVDNALRHTPTNTRIVVASARTTEAIRLTVSDNGPGVPEAERGRIFARFHRTRRRPRDARQRTGSQPGGGDRRTARHGLRRFRQSAWPDDRARNADVGLATSEIGADVALGRQVQADLQETARVRDELRTLWTRSVVVANSRAVRSRALG